MHVLTSSCNTSVHVYVCLELALKNIAAVGNCLILLDIADTSVDFSTIIETMGERLSAGEGRGFEQFLLN